MKYLLSVILYLCITNIVCGWDFKDTFEKKTDDFFLSEIKTLPKLFPEQIRFGKKSKIQLKYSETGNKPIMFSNILFSNAIFKFKDKKLYSINIGLKLKAKNAKEYKTQIESLSKAIAAMPDIKKKRKFASKSRTSRYGVFSWECPKFYISLKWRYKNSRKSGFSSSNPSIFIQKKIIYFVHLKKMERAEALNKYGRMIDKEKINIETKKNDHFLNLPAAQEKNLQQNLYVSLHRIVSYYNSFVPKSKNKYKLPVTNITDNNLSALYKNKFLRAIHVALGDKRLGTNKLANPECYKSGTAFIQLINNYNVYTSGEKLSRSDMKFFTTSAISTSKNAKWLLCSWTEKGYTYLINPGLLLRFMVEHDMPAFRKARCKMKDSRIRWFRRRVCQQINRGVPVLWDTINGVINLKDEPLFEDDQNNDMTNESPNYFEYTMVIVGYNKEDDEVLYLNNSDKGNKINRMSWEEAWTITFKSATITRRKSLE